MKSTHLMLENLKVLHVMLSINETNSQYNEHCLPLLDTWDLAACTYFAPTLTPADGLTVFPGDGTLRTFFQSLRQALKWRDHDVINIHAPQSGALVALGLIAWWRLPRVRSSTVYTVHDSFYDYSTRNQGLMIVALATFKRIIFCSRAAYDSLPRPLKWLVRDRWDVVQNGADIDRVDRVLGGHKRKHNPGESTIVSVGRLERVKDPTTLIDAFARIRQGDHKLVVMGAGSLQPYLTDYANASEVGESIIFTGLVPRDEVFRTCADADLFVSTSHGEGLPVAVIEAMAARCPVVLSDIPPHRELADGADFIPLVPTGDVSGFATEIQRVMALTEEERSALGQRCRQHVLERFTLSTMHSGTEKVYRKLPGVARISSAAI